MGLAHRSPGRFAILRWKLEPEVGAASADDDLSRSAKFVGDATLEQVGAEVASGRRTARWRFHFNPTQSEPGPVVLLERRP